ncbi:MAG: dTDP-4-dehydrorhamnose 3,5-epimerase [Chitinophagaceae bacterium]
MKFSSTDLNGVWTIELQPMVDTRGWFARTYCKNEFEEIGHYKEWVQFNHSYTRKKGSVRGMHFQLPPHQETKMVRCIRGAVHDVVIDIRKHSETFLKWLSFEITAENRKMIYIPEGFAHGFQTMSEDCELLYHHSAFYKPEAEKGIRYNDPLIGIHWPLPVADVSERDLSHDFLNKNFKGI